MLENGVAFRSIFMIVDFIIEQVLEKNTRYIPLYLVSHVFFFLFQFNKTTIVSRHLISYVSFAEKNRPKT